MKKIDINCDMGESFGTYSFGKDAELMQYISSANIACGFHAGDFSVMADTVQLAKKQGVTIGAHPGFPDLQGFGRRKMDVSPREVYHMVGYQIGALHAIAKSYQVALHHVKPHGALYNMAAADKLLADAIATAVADFDSNLILYGLSNSALVARGRALGLEVWQESFADRSYQQDGTLTPRSQSNACYTDTSSVIEQVLSLVRRGRVKTVNGEQLAIETNTLCIHGDGTHAVEFAQAIHSALSNAEIQISA